MRPEYAVALFARAPEHGRVKRRLAAEIGDAAALHAYRRLLAHALDVLAGCVDCDPALWFEGDAAAFETASGVRPPVRRRQPVGDLGTRMHAALADMLGAHRAAILYGADAPGLGSNDVMRCARLLAAGDDAVLVPALDGGYVLIGLTAPRPALFTDMPWGTDQVADLTRARMRAAGMRWSELPCVRDVDCARDLAAAGGVMPADQ
ncbi:MAG: TIGR04282 family arsenosugar biosynthesis glycosyltransferase [Gammaproteobacteria bacterium]